MAWSASCILFAVFAIWGKMALSLLLSRNGGGLCLCAVHRENHGTAIAWDVGTLLKEIWRKPNNIFRGIFWCEQSIFQIFFNRLCVMFHYIPILSAKRTKRELVTTRDGLIVNVILWIYFLLEVYGHRRRSTEFQLQCYRYFATRLFVE